MKRYEKNIWTLQICMKGISINICSTYLDQYVTNLDNVNIQFNIIEEFII